MVKTNKRKKMNINKTTLLIIIISVIVLLSVKTCNQSYKIKEQTSLISSLNDTVTIWKDKDSLSHSKIQAITTERVKDFLNIQNLQGENKKLQEEVKKYKGKIKNGGSVTNTVTKVETRVITNTVIDTVYKDNKLYPVYSGTFNKQGWVTGKVTADPDSITIDPLKVKIEQTYVIGQDKTGFLGLGKPKPFIEVINKNPYAETTELKTYQVTSPKPKRGIWLITGLVLGGIGVILLSN